MVIYPSVTIEPFVNDLVLSFPKHSRLYCQFEKYVMQSIFLICIGYPSYIFVATLIADTRFMMSGKFEDSDRKIFQLIKQIV